VTERSCRTGERAKVGSPHGGLKTLLIAVRDVVVIALYDAWYRAANSPEHVVGIAADAIVSGRDVERQ
jgi:hypothetical protein